MNTIEYIPLDTSDNSILLESKLKKHRAFWSSKLSDEDEAVMDGHIDFLRKTNALDNALKIGDTAPTFNLQNQNGEIVSSTELLKNGPLVVSFFRGRWCPYCVEEVKALNNVYSLIQKAGADLVVLSPQAFSKTESQAKAHKLKYNLLVDNDNKVGKLFGLVYEFPDDLRNLYQNTFNNNIQEINEGTAWELPIPARYVIGQDGKILDVQADPDYRFRPEPLTTVDFLNSLNQ